MYNILNSDFNILCERCNYKKFVHILLYTIMMWYANICGAYTGREPEYHTKDWVTT